MNVGRIILVLKMKKSSILAKYIGNFFFIIKLESSLSTTVFIYSTISQISKTKFYVFWTQTCRNWTKLLTLSYYFSHVTHGLKVVVPKIRFLVTKVFL